MRLSSLHRQPGGVWQAPESGEKEMNQNPCL